MGFGIQEKNGEGDYEIEASLGQIVKILKVTLETVDSTAKSFFLIHLLWFQRHPNKYYLPSPCGLWNSTTDSNSFIPIQFIICPTAIKTTEVTLGGMKEDAIVAVPLPTLAIALPTPSLHIMASIGHFDSYIQKD